MEQRGSKVFAEFKIINCRSSPRTLNQSTESQKKRILRDIAADVLPRQAKMCNIIEKGEYKFVYRRYASLYFIVGAPVEMNELIVLEQIHLFVEALDGYFNSGE